MIVEPLEQVVVGVVGTNSSEYIDAVLAVFARGAVAATLRSADDAERIEAAGITEIIVPGATTGWLTLTGFAQPGHVHPGNAQADGATYAQLAFTSGTEGKPKGILLTHGNLDDVTDRLVAAMSLDSSIREYIGVPVYYSFGFGRVRALGRIGGRGYLPPAGFSPQEIAAMLASGDINALSAVPTLLRLLLQEKSLFAGCGNQLRWLEIGSQYLSQLEKLELKNLFPRATIVQHYGLTEASRTTFLHIHDAPDAALESVGRCHGAVELRLSADQLIQIRGPHVARAQLRDGATQALTDADGWLTTSDLGRLDAGLLYFDGRADDVINCGGVKISPDSLQLQLERAFGLAGAIAVARIPDPLRGDSILVAHLRSAAIDPQALRDATERILHGIGINLGNAIAYMPVDSLPMTTTGKLIRKQLAAEYAQQRPADVASASTPADAAADNTLEQRLVAIWEDVLNIRPIARTDSFFDIGGDSLSAIRIIMRMEKLGIPKTVCQQILRGKSIAAIVDATEGEAKLGNIAKVARSIDVTRGLLVLAVVASHWSPGLMEYLPAALGQINRVFAPVYSAGTPGFAIIFGIGAGFFLLHRRHTQPGAVWQNVSKNAKILLFGLLCLAAVRIVALLVQQQPITPVAVANTFWSAITFYLLAAVTLPLWLNLIVRFSNVLFGALLLALASFATHILIDDFIAPAPSSNPLVQLVILSVTAKYNYFEMAMGAFIGIGLGNWLRAGADSKSPPSTPLLQIAALLTAFALIMSHETGETAQWLEWPRPLFLWSWMFYIGAVIGSIGIVHHITTHAADNSRRQVAANVFATLGVMAFPIFIGHEMVLPLRAIFAAVGIPAPLLLAMLIFLCPTVYFTVKLYRIYYTSPIVAVRELRGSRYESTT